MIVSKVVKPKHKMIKRCKYPDCEKEFMGYGPSKYCEEHSKPKYRKHINKILLQKKLLKQPKIENINQIIHHKLSCVINTTLVCNCCGEPFEVQIRPRTYVYPKYCSTHRNEYKRKMYLMNKEKGGIV